MRPTGRNTTRTGRPTARTTSSSTWTRCGPTPNIDFVGIDNYLPMSDWRDGSPNVDSDPVAGPFTIYDKSYLADNVEGGEDFDWYYASAADRVAPDPHAHRRHGLCRALGVPAEGHPLLVGERPPLAGRAACATRRDDRLRAAGQADLVHRVRLPGGRQGRRTSPTSSTTRSRRESSLPYFSRGSKDDPIQRAYLETMLAYWRDHAPTSTRLWRPDAVDATTCSPGPGTRGPFRTSPAAPRVWHDTPNYELGHWLTGRAGEVPLKWIIAELCAAVGVDGLSTRRTC